MTGSGGGFYLYQVGNVLLGLSGYRWDEPETEVKGKPTSLPYAGRHIAPNERYIPDVQTISVDAELHDDGTYTRAEKLALFRQMVGENTVLTGYLPYGSNGELCEDCGGEARSFVNSLYWLQAVGRVASVSSKRRDDAIPQVTIDVEVHGYWRELNPYLWEPSGGFAYGLGHTNTIESPYTGVVVDASPDQFLGDCYQWRYVNPVDFDFVYDPDFWAVRFREEYTPFNALSFGGRGATWSDSSKAVTLDPPLHLFNAPPTSIYALRGMLVDRTFYVVTWREDGLRTRRDAWSLSTSALNSALVDASYSSLATTDMLLFGDIRYAANNKVYRPAVLIRADGTVADITVPFTQVSSTGGGEPARYIGMLSAGRARVALIGQDGMENAYLHIYQRI
jgi:hypothetical protein